jgi:hypothetical protein
MVMSRDQNAGRNHNIKTDNSSFERGGGTSFTNQNSIQEEIKSRVKSGNACYYSVRNLLSSTLLLKNIKSEIYKNTILPVVLNGCENWSFTLREERRLSVFENIVLRRIFGPKKKEVIGERRKLHSEKPKLSVLLPNIVRVK